MEANRSVVGFSSAAIRLFVSAVSHIKVVKDSSLLFQQCPPIAGYVVGRAYNKKDKMRFGVRSPVLGVLGKWCVRSERC